MCCSRLNTEVILANLIAAKGRSARFSMEDLESYVQFLSDSIPGYVTSDLCEERVLECAAEYPQLYQAHYTPEGDLVVQAGKMCPCVDFFNSGYSREAAGHIREMSNLFLAAERVH